MAENTTQSTPSMKIKVGNVWKEGKPYIKVNGVWKEATDVFIKVGGVWKRAI